MTQVITILLGIALAMVVLVIASIGILIYYIKSDKPSQDDYTNPTKILGGTCNWDEDQDK